MLIRRLNIYWISTLLLLGCLPLSCKKDFLDIEPKGYLIAGQVSDYDAMLNSGFSLGVPCLFMLGDEIAALVTPFEATSSRFEKNAFKWLDDIYLPTDELTDYDRFNNQLYVYNKIINEVMGATGGTDQQKRSIRAEALASRAYIYLMLVNLYAKPYYRSTANTDLGIPLVKDADVTQTKFIWATIQQTYDQLIEDLNLAIPNLPQKVSNRIRMSSAAAKTLLAKAYVFMGKFELALPLLDATIKELQGASIAVGLYNFNKELAASGAFYPINVDTGPARNILLNDQEIIYLKTGLNFYNYIYNGFILHRQTVDLFGPNDLRRKFMTPYAIFSSKLLPLGMMRAYGKGYSNLGVNVPDMYLLRAECRARLGEIGTAAQELFDFRQMRMPMADAIVPTAVAANKNALIQFILDERIREFALNGDRWFDMRRLSVDPEFAHTVGKNHYIYDENGQVTATYNLKPERLTLRIPLYIMAANPTMPQNP